MSQQDKADRLPISAWQVESLRVTAFPTSPAPAGDLSWWTSLMGEPPETRITQPKRGGHREEGSFLGATLVNQVQPNRVDWLLTLTPSLEPGVMDLPTIGPFPELLEPFVGLMHRWLELETCPPLWRLAFGAILLVPVESREPGYRHLSAYLPSVHLDPVGSSDFLYQINRPRGSNSGVAGLTINRLCRWSVALIQLVGFPAGVPLPLDRMIEQQRHACRLELDINTSPSFRVVLPREQVPLVFRELVDLAREIVGEGDVP